MSYTYGIHTYLFSQRLDLDLDVILDKAQEFGYNGIEVPFNLEEYVPWKRLPAALQSRGLDCTTCAGLPKDCDIISADSGARERGIHTIKRFINRARELNSPILGGVLSSAWGNLTGFAPTVDEWKRSVEALQIAAEYAQQMQIKLALEPVNRYESHFINTVKSGKRLVEEIDNEWVGLLLDTYHMNTEEKDLASAVRLAGKHLMHVHACENDRGIPGSGHVDWPGIFRALKDIEYSGRLTIESFVPEMETIARETAIWRKVAPSGDQIAKDGLIYLKKLESLVAEFD
jgi:D-psicose/D-tagatose/L-ribulose 3-epimerase